MHLVKSFTDPDDAIIALASLLRTVASEPAIPVAGRVLAEPIFADRDSPAADVSAMDGYAIRIADLSMDRVSISGEAQPGQPPTELMPGTAQRIFTGAVVPHGAEAIVMREDTDESSVGSIVWLDRVGQLTRGGNIRFQGENGKAGDSILNAGSLLTSAKIAAAANFGASLIALHRAVRVTIIVTGNELLDIHSSPTAWQLRDSNGPTIAAVCSQRSWIDCRPPTRCGDNVPELKQRLEDALANSDAVILTGGVSKGDYDHVPGVIADLGAQTVFHQLPIRPGRPILGAVSKAGQLILGLPGNPVSAIVGMTRFGIPLLAKQSGQLDWQALPRLVTVARPSDKTLHLHWYRLVRLISPTMVELIDSQGSGDLVALSQSTGVIHQPPNTTGTGPWSYFAW